MSRLGRTELVVPTCGFGGIPLGREHLHDDEAVRLLRRAVDEGLLLIDTFGGYGRSEYRIGRAIQGRRGQVTLVTKSRARFAPDAFAAAIEESLKTLRVERIDILLLKNVDEDVDLANVETNIEVLRRFQEQGKVGYIGLSSHSPEHACRAVETGLIDVAEVPYNYANRHFEKVLDLAVEKDVGILAMKPLGGGRLFPDVPKGAPETAETVVQALSFAMSHPSQPVLIPGIGSQAELDRYLEARSRLRALSPEEKDCLAERVLALGDDFCRACGYCRPVCPAGIPIDEVLPLADRVRHVRTDETYGMILKKRFRSLAAQVAACEECGKCVEECPYDLPIPDRLKEAIRLLGP